MAQNQVQGMLQGAYSPNNLGTVLSLNGAGSGQYVDRLGRTQPNGLLKQTYSDVSANDEVPSCPGGILFHAGASGSLAASVHLGFGAAATIFLKLEARRVDPNNPGAFSFEPVLTRRIGKNGVSTSAFEHQLTAADGGDLRILTADERLSNDLMFSAKTDVAVPTELDQIHVGVDVGGS